MELLVCFYYCFIIILLQEEKRKAKHFKQCLGKKIAAMLFSFHTATLCCKFTFINRLVTNLSAADNFNFHFSDGFHLFFHLFFSFQLAKVFFLSFSFSLVWKQTNMQPSVKKDELGFNNSKTTIFKEMRSIKHSQLSVLPHATI